MTQRMFDKLKSKRLELYRLNNGKIIEPVK